MDVENHILEESLSMHIKENITSEIKSLRTLFKDNIVFKIPDFQRDFVWGRKEVNKLFDDLAEDTDDFEDISGEGYLLGNIVTIKTNESDKYVKEVIDGQQRLTVLSLVFYALHELLEKIIQDITLAFQNKEIDNTQMLKDVQFWSGLKNELDIAYYVKTSEGQELKIQHDPSLLIANDYRSFFLDADNQISDENKYESSKIYSVYEVIKERVDSLYYESDKEGKIENFINYLRDNVYLIETSAVSLSKAFQLFEVLNQRGVGLTPLDLIKNMLLKKLVESESDENIKVRRKEFGNIWSEFVSKLEFEDRRRNPINSSTFLKHYLLGKKGRKVTDKQLFDYFSDEIKADSQEILKLIRDFLEVLTVYREIEQKNYHAFTTYDHSTLILKLLFESFENKQAHALLMPFYNKDEELKAKVLNYTVRLVASIYFSESSPANLEKIIGSANKKLYSSKNGYDLESFFTYIQNEIEYYSNKARAVVEINRYSNYRNKPNSKSKYLFKFIEVLAHNQDPFSQKGNRKGRKVISLEHIMPQSLKEEEYKYYGINSEVEHKELLNRIGNLAIIEGRFNASMQNKPYKYKKKYFKESNYYTTKSLAGKIDPVVQSGYEYEVVKKLNDYFHIEIKGNKDYWDIEKIQERSRIIAEYLEDVLNAEPTE